MNLQKAIEILEKVPANINNPWDFDQQNALKLGIEALKRLKVGRRAGHPYFTAKLPGET